MIGLYTDAAKIDFKTNYDDKAPVYESVFGESFYLIELLKAVYDWALLAEVLHDEKYLSYAKIDVYNKHRDDLKFLKEYVEKYAPDKKDIFLRKIRKSSVITRHIRGMFRRVRLKKSVSNRILTIFLKSSCRRSPAKKNIKKCMTKLRLKRLCPKSLTKTIRLFPCR